MKITKADKEAAKRAISQLIQKDVEYVDDPPKDDSPSLLDHAMASMAPAEQDAQDRVVISQAQEPVAKSNQPTYVLGKRYAPKSDRNMDTWTKLTNALKEGPRTMAELREIAKDHTDFLGYMVRGHHLITKE